MLDIDMPSMHVAGNHSVIIIAYAYMQARMYVHNQTLFYEIANYLLLRYWKFYRRMQ
jgi:hypothetical protein